MKKTIYSFGMMTMLGYGMLSQNIQGATKQVLNVMLEKSPRTTDSAKSTDTASGNLLTLVFEGLTGVEATPEKIDKIVPAGAAEWKISPDGKVYTFKLQPNAKWSDGKPVTAQDYKYGVMRVLNPETASLNSYDLYVIKGAENYNTGKGKAEDVGIKVIDDHTLEFSLEYPTANFLSLCYTGMMYPQRKDIIEKSGERYGTEAEFTIGNGAFLLKEWVHGNKAVFEKNPYYWDSDNIKITQINMPVITDENSRMNMLFSGQADIGTVSKSDWIKKFKTMKEFEHTQTYSLRIRYELMNTKSKYLKNEKIRKAYSLAMNREEFNQVVFEGAHIPAYGWVSNGVNIGGKEYRSLVEEPVKKLQKDNPDPVALLKEGLKELGLPEDPSKVTITYLSPGTDASSKKAMEYTQQMIKKNLGINLEAEFVEWPTYLKRTEDLEYEIGSEGWTIGNNDPIEFFKAWTSKSNIVPNGWSNKEYDELIFKAERTMDQNERLKALKAAEKILIEDESVVAPLAYLLKDTFVKKSLKNYNPPLAGPYNYKGVSVVK